MSMHYPTSDTQEWKRARQAAFTQDVLATFTQRSSDLLPFEEVRKRLGLRHVRYLGLQDVPLDQIVGSVGRYRDFTRAFFPRQDDMGNRWRRIDRLVSTGGGLPPIELYKVGQVYFVRDGNHRVSVARQHNAPAIQAYVWEYKTRVPLEPDTDVDDLLSKAAHAAFLERTNVDHLCPDLHIELTQPDGYEDLLYEIEAFQHSISTIDEREVGFEEAVTLWCDMHYTPIVQIVRQRDVLQEFPGRTEADLYLWLRRNQEELEVRYGEHVLMEEAAADLAKRFGEKPTPARQIKKAIERLAGGVGELGGRLVESITPDTQAQEQDLVAAALLAPIRRVATTTPPYRFRGTNQAEWKKWHTEFRERLWDLLGVGDRPWQPYGPDELKAEIEERTQIDGLWRELIWLTTEKDCSDEYARQSLRVPVYLFLPAEANEPRPAVIVFPGHGTIAQTAGLEKSYQRANALELARAGFVTLTMELRGFGRLGAMGHLQIDAAARLVDRTWYGLLVQDGMRAIDYLMTRPEVDSDRIGATGIGAGGALTMYTTALDDRVKVALVNSYLGKYVVTCLDEEHCPCNDIPGILRYAEMGDVAALIGPRPVMFVSGQRDPATPHAARGSFGIVRQVYRILGVPQRAKLIEPEKMGHYFDNQLASGWFRRWLARNRVFSKKPGF
ncbi:MAG: acetylxylan esterase [Chloroflexota bacterium]|nr:acetylxylan esterase [Chloroflexota bacterium]